MEQWCYREIGVTQVHSDSVFEFENGLEAISSSIYSTFVRLVPAPMVLHIGTIYCMFHVLASSSFCVVAITFGNSWMAGLNLSCKSQILVDMSWRIERRLAGFVQEGGICYAP